MLFIGKKGALMPIVISSLNCPLHNTQGMFCAFFCGKMHSRPKRIHIPMLPVASKVATNELKTLALTWEEKNLLLNLLFNMQ